MNFLIKNINTFAFKIIFLPLYRISSQKSMFSNAPSPWGIRKIPVSQGAGLSPKSKCKGRGVYQRIPLTKLFAKIGAKRQESASCTFFQFPISKKMSPDQVGDILLQSFKEINLKSNQVFVPGKISFFLEMVIDQTYKYLKKTF